MNTNEPNDAQLDPIQPPVVTAEIAAVRAIAAEATADPAALVRVRNRLTAHGRPLAGNRSSGWIRIAIAASVALLLIIVGAFATSMQRQDTEVSNAQNLLIRAADAAEKSTDPQVRQDQYLKITTIHRWSSGIQQDCEGCDWAVVMDKETFTTWKPGDPTKPWWLERSGRVPQSGLNEAGRKYMQTPRGPTVPHEVRSALDGQFYGPTTPTWREPTDAWMGAIPRDPQELRRRLAADVAASPAPSATSPDVGPSVRLQAFNRVMDLLQTGRVPSDLRAALFRTLALVEGITVTEQAAQLEGRTGVAIGILERGGHLDIVLDPATGEFIGIRNVVTVDTPSGIKAGSVIGQVTVTGLVVMNSAPTSTTAPRPMGTSRPTPSPTSTRS